MQNRTVAEPWLCAAGLKGDQRVEAWGQGAQAGLDAIQHYGGAKPGDRTMLDALSPAIDTFCSQSRSGLHHVSLRPTWLVQCTQSGEGLAADLNFALSGVRVRPRLINCHMLD